ncbi:probable cyclin-dependent serine/threonine-protein kinase DDB_G0292550 [Eleutherodactylus coqui]|uniref:probable cyclin-dependent serine/threonine-protein kinase DDB_G0292550 n=1 Tax=Eleutherodactylus coqui TaxID=57060 RepID=UPI00346219A5
MLQRTLREISVEDNSSGNNTNSNNSGSIGNNSGGNKSFSRENSSDSGGNNTNNCGNNSISHRNISGDNKTNSGANNSVSCGNNSGDNKTNSGANNSVSCGNNIDSAGNNNVSRGNNSGEVSQENSSLIGCQKIPTKAEREFKKIMDIACKSPMIPVRMLQRILREISVENNSICNNTNSGSNNSGSCGNNSGDYNTNSGANNSVSCGNNSDNGDNNVSRGNNSGELSAVLPDDPKERYPWMRKAKSKKVSREMLDLLEQLINWLPQNSNKALLFDPGHCGQVAAIKDSHIQVVEERRSLLGHVISMAVILNTTILASTSVFLIGSNVNDDLVPAPQDDPEERYPWIHDIISKKLSAAPPDDPGERYPWMRKAKSKMRMLRQILREISVENNSSGNNTNSGSNSSGSCGNNSGGNNTNSGANNSVSRGNNSGDKNINSGGNNSVSCGNNSDNSGNNVSRGNNSGGSNTKSSNNSNCQQCCRMTRGEVSLDVESHNKKVSREMLDLLEQLINWLPQNPNKARTSGPEVHLRPVIILTLPSMNVLFDPGHCGQVAAIKNSHIQVVEERRSLLGHVISMTAILNTTILASTSVFLIGSNVNDDIVPAPQDDPEERTVSNTDNSRNNSISHGNNSGDNKTNSGANNRVSRGNNSGELSQEMLDFLEQHPNWLPENPNKGRRNMKTIRKPYCKVSTQITYRLYSFALISVENYSVSSRNNSGDNKTNSRGYNSVSRGNNSGDNKTNSDGYNSDSCANNTNSGSNNVSRGNNSGGNNTKSGNNRVSHELSAAPPDDPEEKYPWMRKAKSKKVSQEMLDLLEQLINWLSQNPNKGRRSRMNIRKPFLEGSNNNSDSCGNNSDIGRNNSVSRGNNSGGNNSVSCGNNSSGNNTNVKNGVSHRKNSSGNNSVSRENDSGGTKPTAAATTASAVEIAAAAKTVSAVETTASSVERTAAATTPTAVAKTV